MKFVLKSAALVVTLILGGVSLASAGDARVWRYNKHSAEPPFPTSERAQSVWASGACWSECGSATTWNLIACLKYDTQGRCLKRADAGDRMCQRTCRTSGGPWLPIDTLFPFGH